MVLKRFPSYKVSKFAFQIEQFSCEYTRCVSLLSPEHWMYEAQMENSCTWMPDLSGIVRVFADCNIQNNFTFGTAYLNMMILGFSAEKVSFPLASF